jgi:hypothetical protein
MLPGPPGAKQSVLRLYESVTGVTTPIQYTSLLLIESTKVRTAVDPIPYVMGVLNPSNQYNIYWFKYNRLSILLFLSSSCPKTQPLDSLVQISRRDPSYPSFQVLW